MAKEILSTDNVEMNVTLNNKEEAIRKTGNILVEQGYVKPDYVEKMLEREEIATTYMGNYVAIPHGTDDSKSEVISSGLSIVHVPEGVDFGDGQIVKLLIGIAGQGDEHLEILSQIAIVCSEESQVEEILSASSKDELIAHFNEVN